MSRATHRCARQGIFRCFAAPERNPREGAGKSKLDTFGLAIRALVDDNFVARHFGVALASLSNWLRKRGIKRQGKNYSGFGAYVEIRSTLSQNGT